MEFSGGVSACVAGLALALHDSFCRNLLQLSALRALQGSECQGRRGGHGLVFPAMFRQLVSHTTCLGVWLSDHPVAHCLTLDTKIIH